MKLSTSTRATVFLQSAGAEFHVVEYDFDPRAEKLAMHAASAIGLEPERVLKTLMLEVDKHPVCVVIPADRSLSLKKVAKVAGGKHAALMPPAKAERLTGYNTGGISPFAQRQQSPVFFEQSAMDFPRVAVNGGKRGLLVLLSPQVALHLLAAQSGDLCA